MPKPLPRDSTVPLGDLLRSHLTPGGSGYAAGASFHRACPGTVSDYSNLGATLAAYLVEVIDGRPFERFTREHIFAPLGMSETAWQLAGLDRSHIAMPYHRQGSGRFRAVGHYGELSWPDGMLRTSVPQLARFLIMFAQYGEYSGRRLLSRRTAREMRRPQIPRLDSDQGLIWFYDDFGGSRRRVLGHNGQDTGVATHLFFDPRDGVGVIILANGDWNNAEDESPAANRLTAELFHAAGAL